MRVGRENECVRERGVKERKERERESGEVGERWVRVRRQIGCEIGARVRVGERERGERERVRVGREKGCERGAREKV